jgi:peptide/nickel transport system ATP-binding protein
MSETADAITRYRGAAGDIVMEIDDLTVQFPTDDGLVSAVRGVSYQVRRGEVLGIVGESGSGKSVSSLAVMGLLPRNARIQGSAKVLGQEVLGLSDKELSQIRGQHISMIFQDPLTSLTPVYTVGTQLTVHHKVSKKAARARSIELLELLGIPNAEGRVDAYPHELSGGMRQRVVIAIAIANEPDVIIADEPTTALDVTVQAQVLEALQVAREETGAGMVLITHDLGVVAGYADRVCVMYTGRLVETGTAEDIFYSPRMPYTMGLLGSLPRMDSDRSGRLTPILGTPPSLVNIPPGCPFAPRCPLARDACTHTEPPLEQVGEPDHASACLFHTELIDKKASDFFSTTSADPDLVKFGLTDPDLEVLS